MQEVLNNPLFYVFALPMIATVVATIAHYWYKTRKLEIEASLKHEMIQRGMSPSEIQIVLNAKCSPEETQIKH